MYTKFDNNILYELIKFFNPISLQNIINNNTWTSYGNVTQLKNFFNDCGIEYETNSKNLRCFSEFISNCLVESLFYDNISTKSKVETFLTNKIGSSFSSEIFIDIIFGTCHRIITIKEYLRIKDEIEKIKKDLNIHNKPGIDTVT